MGLQGTHRSCRKALRTVISVRFCFPGGPDLLCLGVRRWKHWCRKWCLSKVPWVLLPVSGVCLWADPCRGAHPAGQGPGSAWGSRSLWESRGGARTATDPGGGAHAFLYELPQGSPAQATLPGPDPPLGPERVRGTDRCSCGHPQTRPRPNAGEASVVKWSAYFWPKIDFI